jgi:hypothetical protein
VKARGSGSFKSVARRQELQFGGSWSMKATAAGSFKSVARHQELQFGGSKSTKARGAKVGA